MALSAETMTWTAHTAPSSTMKGTAQSALRPVSRRSVNTCENAGFTMASSEVMAQVSMTKTMAAEAPRRRSSAKVVTLAGSPDGSNSSVGVMDSTTPVNSRSNSSMESLTRRGRDR